MKIFILGHGKSGTTVFLYKVAGGLPIRVLIHVHKGAGPQEHAEYHPQFQGVCVKTFCLTGNKIFLFNSYHIL